MKADDRLSASWRGFDTTRQGIAQLSNETEYLCRERERKMAG